MRGRPRASWRSSALLLGLVGLAATPLLAAAQDETETEASEGFACPMEVEVPWTYKEEVRLDLAESVKFDDGANPLALSTVCTCPAMDDGAMSTVCTCEGPKEDDCDTYARIMAWVLLTAEKFLGVLMHMGELEAKYHIHNVAFWVVLGHVLGWIGVILVLYSEVKAVLIVRERDERDRLVAGNFLRRNEKKIRELNAKEEAMLMPRPYVTMLGIVLLWLGILLQLLPFCDVLALIFPGLEFFHGMCWLFVIFLSLVVAAASALLLVGLIWACTRGWAALVLIALGVLGEALVLSGMLAILIWLAVSAAVLVLYFKVLPEHLEEQGSERYWWLQDLGNWYKVSHDMDDWMVAASQLGDGLGSDGLGIVQALPGGTSIVDLVTPSSPASQRARADDAADASGAI